MNLLRSIVSEAWAIDESYALRMMPFISSILSGEKVNLEEISSKTPVQFVTTARGAFLTYESLDNESASEGFVAVLPIHNVLLKYDAFCGPMGMKTMETLLKQWDDNPDIVGIVLDIDSPGGQAGYLPNLSETIKGLKKPIISFYSGLCASAAYYIASQTNEIWGSTETDLVGSIGTMIQFATPHPEQKDVVIHTVYATKSTDKNKPIEEAIKGKYDLLRTSLLDPINEGFHAAVLSARPDVEESALSGSTYTTQKATEMKLIDGRLANLQEAIARVFTLSKAKNQTSNNQNTNSEMKDLAKISAILGREVTAETVLTIAELEMIENAMANPTPAATENPAPTAEEIAASMSGSITEAVTAGLAPVQKSIGSIEERLSALESGAGAEATVSTPTTGANAKDYTDEPWADPENPINKHFDSQIGG